MSSSQSDTCGAAERLKLKSFNSINEEARFRLNNRCYPPLKKCTSYKGKGDVLTSRLIQVFQVCIDKFDDIERRGEVYGKIEVINLDGPFTLYDQDRGSSEHVRANHNISLKGPPQAISQVVGFAVNIGLWLCGDSELNDVQLSKWQLSWDALKPKVAHITRGPFFRDFCDRSDVLSSEAYCRYESAGYDQPLSANFKGLNGSCITMYYAILQHAVQAWVQVEVIDVNVALTVVEYNVRGSISATYGHFENDNDSDIKDSCKTTLVKTGDLQSLKVERWSNIQLSRCIIAVPVYSSLIIEADLWDTSLLKIAKGKLEFTPSHMGFDIDYISGDDDIAIRVIVFWSYGSKLPPKKIPP